MAAFEAAFFILHDIQTSLPNFFDIIRPLFPIFVQMIPSFRDMAVGFFFLALLLGCENDIERIKPAH